MRQEFPNRVKRDAAVRANGKCEQCGLRLRSGEYHYDHVIPDGLGGEPILSNCEVLCRTCHNIKTRTKDVPAIAKAKRNFDRERGIKKSGNKPLPFSRQSHLKKKMDGTIVHRHTGQPISGR
jgi:5-methylcytosine-specific restriction endonuclease McrA